MVAFGEVSGKFTCCGQFVDSLWGDIIPVRLEF
jgi:hypothetical protein